MDTIEKMMTGQMDMQEFVHLLKNSVELQNAIRSLIPLEAINNRAHSIWAGFSYEALEKYHFDLLDYLVATRRLDGTISDNLNIFGPIRHMYCFSHPETVCTSRYRDEFDLYLSVVGDCLDGPEVRALVMTIVQEALSASTKKQRLAQAKSKVSELFHIAEKGAKRPRWIQGPQWPMGRNSPMKFLCKKRKGEMVIYEFEDVDTGETRTVEQFF